MRTRQVLRMVSGLLIGVTVSGLGQNGPQDYPQWRGRNRDGSASTFLEPKSWPEKLTLRWKVEVGEGYATPILVGHTVYSFTRRGDNEVMMAVEAGSGKELWHTGYPAPYTPGSPAAAHGAGPKATPLFHQGKLFTLGISGVVSAFDAATGKLLWQKPAPPVPPFFGTAVSPVGDKNLVILHPGNYGPLTAFDVDTGEIRWTAGGGGFFASPMIVDLESTRQVVAVTQENIVGVSLADGALLWQYPWAPATPSAITPILYGGTIMVGGQDMGITALRPVRHDGKWQVEVVWEAKEVSLFLSNPVLTGDTLYGLSHLASGQFFALDARSGKVLWLGPPRQAKNTAIVKAGNFLFFLNDDATLIVATRPTRQDSNLSNATPWLIARPGLSQRSRVTGCSLRTFRRSCCGLSTKGKRKVKHRASMRLRTPA